jgi:hypothetical protein
VEAALVAILSLLGTDPLIVAQVCGTVQSGTQAVVSVATAASRLEFIDGTTSNVSLRHFKPMTIKKLQCPFSIHDVLPQPRLANSSMSATEGASRRMVRPPD